ncbi:MAG: hypothetical protein ACJAWL_003441 [Motiliproteus sp.]
MTFPYDQIDFPVAYTTALINNTGAFANADSVLYMPTARPALLSGLVFLTHAAKVFV